MVWSIDLHSKDENISLILPIVVSSRSSLLEGFHQMLELSAIVIVWVHFGVD
jgi:hypothetical protein